MGINEHPHPIEDEPGDCNHHPEVEEDCEADNQAISWEEGP